MTGISKSTRATAEKTIVPTEKQPIRLAYIEKVEVIKTLIKEDSKLTAFIGLEQPRLAITFAEVTNDKSEEVGHYTETFFPVNPEISELGLKVQHEKMFSKLKHFITVLKRRMNNVKDPITDEEYKLLDLYTKANEKQSYTEQVALYSNVEYYNEYERFFNNVAKLFVGDKKKKGIIVDEKGKIILWLKLIYPAGKSFVRTPDFVGNGIIELYTQNKPTTLKISISKGESIKETSITKIDTSVFNANPENANIIPDWAK